MDRIKRNIIKKQILDSADFCNHIKAPRLKKLCQFINDSKKFIARLEMCNNVYKDRHISGTRLRNQGIREYKGNILRIYDLQENLVKEHDSTETYRQNYEVCQWIKDNIIEAEK